MKRVVNKNILFAVLAFFSFAACSLEETDLPFVNQQSFYRTEAQCRSVVNGCYIEIADIYHSSFLLMVEACTDLYYCTTTTEDARLEISPSKPEFGATIWKRGYRGVDLCNEAIACIGATKYVDDAVKMPMVAECRVLRAMYYYVLTNTFNGVPFYTCQVNTYAVQDSIRYLGRTPANEIRKYLYDDLRDNALPYFTEENGLKCREVEAPQLRSGYAHALMLMAKFAMWYGEDDNYEDALWALKELEKLYGTFNESNYPLDEIRWSHKKGVETIFEIQHEYDVAGITFAGTVAKMMMPTRGVNAQGKFLWDGVDLPGYGNTMPSVAVMRVNPKFASFRTYKSAADADKKDKDSPDDPYRQLVSTSKNCVFGYKNLPVSVEESRGDKDYYYVDLDHAKLKTCDRRAVLNFAFGNWETGEAFNYIKKDGYFYSGEKFWCPNILQNYDSNNYKIFRYADAILMLAECYCHREDSENAFRYLNMVRERAGVAPHESFTGYEDLLTSIINERAFELCGEFHRKWDLVRWGIWYQKTYDNTAYTNGEESLQANMRPCHEYYPIPDKQCSMSGYALDNPAYTEYGLN